MQIYLIRHTTPGVASGTCYGRADVPLAPQCDAEISVVAAKLAGLAPLERVYSSPSTRCVILAEALARQAGAERAMVRDPRLRELHFGAWEMRAWDTLPRAEIAHWSDDFVHRAPPDGESFAELNARVGAFFDALLANEDESATVAVVTHGGVIRSVWSRLLAIPPANIFRLHIGYGAAYRVTWLPAPDYCSISVL